MGMGIELLRKWEWMGTNSNMGMKREWKRSRENGTMGGNGNKDTVPVGLHLFAARQLATSRSIEARSADRGGTSIGD